MSNEHVRISDAERNAAITQLGTHFASGRLTITEYEQRCDVAVGATTRGELTALFQDLPSRQDERSYTVAEIDALRQRNAKPKAGLVGLTAIGSIAGSILLNPMWPSSFVLMLLIPTVFVLLYVMKIGPQDWYLPTPQQLQRQRLRELQTRTKMRELEMRQENQARKHELAKQAMNVAQGFLKRK